MNVLEVIRDNSKYLAIMTMPFVLAFVLIVLGNSYVLSGILVLIVMFLVVGKVPICRHRENLWIFLILFGCSIPYNLFWSYRFGTFLMLLYESYNWTEYVLSAFCYGVLLSLEEILVGILARFIWRKQYPLYIDL